jgi:DNA-binding CsgD family transcriptional regulator
MSIPVQTTIETPAVVISRDDGTVIAQNAPAREMMGAGMGGMCWDVVPGLEEAEGLPCRKGCVRELLTSGLEQSQLARVLVKGRRHELTCVPLGGSVVCMLNCAVGEDPESWELLTRRERSVLQLLADGETTASAARKLEISSATVRTHVEHMRTKLGAKTRAALVSLGHRFGFLT